jgi:acetyl-CoA carboxylase carboxyl transferase subunit beta
VFLIEVQGKALSKIWLDNQVFGAKHTGSMWFKKKGLKPTPKKEIPDGLWLKCKSCGELLYRKELAKNYWVCENCDYHFKIPARGYVDLLTDKFTENDDSIESSNPLNFPEYDDKLKSSVAKCGGTEAIITGEGEMDSHRVAFGVMVFQFMGGSMGSVVGEKVSQLIDFAIQEKVALIIVGSSGGARMQEGILSLMQMPKTAGALALLSESGLPYISVLTSPTTGGVMASFASLGDIVIAEPQALIGFAGPRVIRQTINQELPEGFQTSEFLLEHGLIDAVVRRHELKPTITRILGFLQS